MAQRITLRDIGINEQRFYVDLKPIPIILRNAGRHKWHVMAETDANRRLMLFGGASKKRAVDTASILINAGIDAQFTTGKSNDE